MTTTNPDPIRDGDALPGKHVRVCEEHGVQLVERPGDRLFCEGSRVLGWRAHFVTSWKVVDRHKRRAVARAEEERRSDRSGGTGIQDLKEELMPRGPQPRSTPPPAAAPSAPTPKSASKRTLSRAKFTAAGEVLWLRVLQVVTKLGGDPFRVTWEIGAGKKGAGQRMTFGIVSTHADSAAAEGRYQEARAGALKDGWKEVPILPGRRPIAFMPVPKPGTLAKTKGGPR